MAGIYRRGKVYWARAQRGGREFRRSLKTADRSIAERRLRQWLTDLDAIAWGDKPRRSFEEAASRFIREHMTTLKPGGAKRYGVSLKNLAVHFGGNSLDQIKSAKLSEFESARRSQGVSSGTVRRDLACLSSMLTSCEDWEWVDAGFNPVPGYLRRRSRRGLKEAPPRTRYLTLDEESRLLRAAVADTIRAVVLAIETGLRREELFSLTWRQIDLVRGLITTTTRTKSGRMRKVPITERSARILAQSPRYLDSPYVLVNEATRTRYVQLNKGLQGAIKRAGIDPLRWHDLRRTAGCRWLQRDGKSMEEVSVLLGHSSVAVTEQRYAFLEAETVAESLSHKAPRDTASGQ